MKNGPVPVLQAAEQLELDLGGAPHAYRFTYRPHRNQASHGGPGAAGVIPPSALQVALCCGAAGQVRRFVSNPGVVNTASNVMDTDHNGTLTLTELDASPILLPFASLLHDQGLFHQQIDAATVIPRGELASDGSLLFSYETLRQITTF